MDKIKILNFYVHEVVLEDLLKDITHWSNKKKKSARFICLSNVHSCIESVRNSKFKNAHSSCHFSLADGRPIFWASRILGSKRTEHIPGYYITEKILKLATKKKLKIGFYGSTSRNLNKIKMILKKKFQRLEMKYSFSPPFRKLKQKENNKIITEINKSKIDILFVCLGCPKQELWMHANKNKLKCTMIGIGAVADFLSGNKILPNKFFEYLGLAWLIRLITEPRRLFLRYFSTNFLFIFLFFLQITGLKKFR
tara:strand:+ start:278 stop:1036 length:759 start_codon:yes stop_codon:yes gene_type:complete